MITFLHCPGRDSCPPPEEHCRGHGQPPLLLRLSGRHPFLNSRGEMERGGHGFFNSLLGEWRIVAKGIPISLPEGRGEWVAMASTLFFLRSGWGVPPSTSQEEQCGGHGHPFPSSLWRRDGIAYGHTPPLSKKGIEEAMATRDGSASQKGGGVGVGDHVLCHVLLAEGRSLFLSNGGV